MSWTRFSRVPPAGAEPGTGDSFLFRAGRG